ncbi:hypothetical protein H3T79_07420 [Snodgrassella sp. M0118]|uniref:hypothetical protein n=1 Tax=unclassified Snodgrassella TaxID=2625236 RepID=UPI0018DB9ABC|nr:MULTISPECIES: hypothetical protein [unclassified Snodgrassella]MBI0068149.1 hypothetical protein [Snodgrassella sp. M0110]MBI0077210.1 hypothetical protein [Snodgrassella sp. M0118]MBI0079449.1 hypothetical protein [Snodgrassella sp. M0112]
MAFELSKAIPVGALKEVATVVNPAVLSADVLDAAALVVLFADVLDAVARVVELTISPLPYRYKVHKAKQAKAMEYKEIFFIMSTR